jgi:hypothetical protein
MGYRGFRAILGTLPTTYTQTPNTAKALPLLDFPSGNK